VFEGLDVEPDLREAILVSIRHRLSPQPVKIRADIEVTCFGYEGIEAIKAALRKGEETSTEATPIRVRNLVNYSC
jgi:translation initiation factor 2 subunit 1